MWSTQDSISTVTTTLHNPPIPVNPMTTQVFLVCSVIRATIVSLRRTLSESQTERYGRLSDAVMSVTEYW